MIKQNSLGVVDRSQTHDRIDYLYRVSIKCFVKNEKGEVLAVKETGRNYWDLPGGGMDHGENLRAAIARELKEEVNLEGSFEYKVISVDEPAYLKIHDFWQVRIIFEVTPTQMQFSAGEDSDEIIFIDPFLLKDSPEEVERRIYTYSQATARHTIQT